MADGKHTTVDTTAKKNILQTYHFTEPIHKGLKHKSNTK